MLTHDQMRNVLNQVLAQRFRFREYDRRSTLGSRNRFIGSGNWHSVFVFLFEFMKQFAPRRANKKPRRKAGRRKESADRTFQPDSRGLPLLYARFGTGSRRISYHLR